MDEFKKYIKGKKITVMGLGLLGSAVGDVEFLAKQGAKLLVTDLKSKSELTVSLKKLKKYKNIKYVLGEHRLKDFTDCDMVLKAGGVPLDSPYIAEARRHKIPVEMSSALFAKFSPATIIGVTGTRGKTTVTNLIYQILKKAGKKVYLGGNVQGVSSLSLLPKAKLGDFVVMELDSWRLQGFGDSRVSPHIAVFTNFFPDHLNHYKGNMDAYLGDKANIFKYQIKNDILILGEQCASLINKKYPKIKSKIIIPNSYDISYEMKIPGDHNIYNATLAVAVAKALKIPEEIIKEAVENFSGVPGRLELIRTYKGIKIYNDTTATTPVATIAALKALNELRKTNYEKRIVLILGGADKGIDMSELIKEIPEYCKAVVLLPGTGTQKLKTKSYKLKISQTHVNNLRAAVKVAIQKSKKGDLLLFSPAFASFGMFKNEYDRGEQFNKLIKGLK